MDDELSLVEIADNLRRKDTNVEEYVNNLMNVINSELNLVTAACIVWVW